MTRESTPPAVIVAWLRLARRSCAPFSVAERMYRALSELAGALSTKRVPG